VFPTASPYESEGTFVNEFKVVQKIRPAVTMGKDTRQVFQVAVDLADRLGVTMPARDIAGLSRWI
jgi:predicted molibdopterin-dependent oxidoreductase YjgC